MSKKFAIIMISLGLSAIMGFTGFGIWHASRSTPSFDLGGYILQGDADEVKWHSFQPGEKYASTLSGTINFDSEEEGNVAVSQESFAHFDDNSMMALSDGVLLDFNDLSDNFINNYYINAGLRISETGGTYTAETTAGSMKFGEHLWKLSEQKYMVAAPSLKVHMSEEDIRDVEDYVQVVITDDGVVHLLTPENLWMTISDQCYIETQGGVRVYPVTQIIDDGTNKLSMAKLSVSADDSIVLTEDETRRQIVPELNIEAIDGEDGEDGEDGQSGQNGENGETGADGEDGEKGADGQQGPTGTTGTPGRPGVSASSGDPGKKGTPGKDAVVESSTNSALPTMTITDWQVSATELKGTIAVTDQGGFLGAISEITDFKTSYPGKVTITDVNTGKVISCYQTGAGYSLDGIEVSAAFDFYTGADAFYFSSPRNALEPDTEYKLSVVAYYKATDQSNLIYSREFISRFFYTDSTGVSLAQVKAETDSLTISASVSESYRSSIASATVYLLTPEQNKTFTAASASEASNYTAASTAIRDTEFITNGWIKEVTFDGTGITPDTQYIARVIVETKTALKVLTNQELEVKTLKRTPVIDTGAVPKAFYNRVTGAFEVYRPVVTDYDGGAVSYTYTAYRRVGGQWTKESSRTITPSTGEPVEFRLPSGEMYSFGVELEFNDNEKLVYYDLGKSEEIASVGDSMPKVTLTPDGSGTDYNRFNGLLRIDLQNRSSIKVDALHPLKLEFYADQVRNDAIELKDGTPVTDDAADGDPAGERYIITLNPASLNTNQLNISLALKNLYKNTNYSITVYGYLDVGDGNGPVNRSIGTASFRTYDTLTLNASWSTPSTVSTAFARTLSLNVQDSQATNVRRDYALDELKDGQVTVELFSGTGTGKLRIAQKNFNESGDLEALFSTGLTITENSFGGPALNPAGNYTLTVSAVADGSYGMDLGYVNLFENVLNASEVVSAEPTPPDLLTDPSKGVKATPIYNKDAVQYGGAEDPDLPDDAIVGYTLESSYDNVQRIGKTITYYAFEYNTFFNSLRQNNDPIKDPNAPLMKMTQPIDPGKDSVPKIALLFGGTQATTDEESTIFNNYQVYRTGAPNLQGHTLQSGMGRGYRYIFAYTVDYAGSSSGESEAVRTYPYDHNEYEDYKRYYGGVKENNMSIGTQIAYMLTSGMCNAPKIMPDFHTYVYSSEPDPLASANAMSATGRVVLHYTWRDPDQRIITDGTDKNTKISYPAGNGTTSININNEKVDGSTKWYTIKIPYVLPKSGETILAPTVDISEYELNYDDLLTAFDYPLDVKEYPIGNIPLDWPWASQFSQSGYNNSVLIKMEPKLDENHIDFYLTGDAAVKDALAQRAVGMELEFTPRDTSVPSKTFRFPLTVDVSGVYARLTTGMLGTEYLGKEFAVSASLFYDTGSQGWEIVENPAKRADGFAMQYTNDATSPELFGFSSYIGASNSSKIPGNGALLQLGTGAGFNISALQNTVGDKEEHDVKFGFTTVNRFSNTSITRYLYPDRMGVDTHNNNNIKSRSGLYAVPKEIKRYSMSFVNGQNTAVLSTMTPTITKPIFVVSSTAVKAGNFDVAGFASGGKVYMAAYTNMADALALNTQHGGKMIPINIGADGKPIADSNTTLNSLESGKKYYFTFYYMKNGTTPVLLLRSDTAESAIFEVTTSANAVIDITRLEYLNESYFEKSFIIDFTISRTFNINLSYDIYGTEADAVNGTNPVLSFDEMNTSGEDDILKEPNILSNMTNTLKIDLTPSMNRNKLKPGGTYWLKITATEPSADPSGSATPAGSVIQQFSISSIGNYGALIYVQQASETSITFRVAINDPQYTLMGRPNNDNEGALYAVRFTDESGNVLRTIYDDKVFSASKTPYQDFILKDDNLLNDSITLNNQIQGNTNYKINIYAVPDLEHNGQITLDGNVRKWDDFFSRAVSSFQECGSNLVNLIKGFWNTNTSNNQSQDGTESQLIIASKMQSTTTAAGWLLNENSIFATRRNINTVRIMFEESFGLIQSGPSGGSEPVFKQIDWQVDGKREDGVPFNISGRQLYSRGDNLLKESTIAGTYNTYFFDIPEDVVRGTYYITIQFRTNEGDPAPAKTIMIQSGV